MPRSKPLIIEVEIAGKHDFIDCIAEGTRSSNFENQGNSTYEMDSQRQHIHLVGFFGMEK